jgi:cation diffusion facilitator family transporter
MHTHPLTQWQHSHNFSSNSQLAEKSASRVMILTAVMMAAEIIAGIWFGSMALLADGWHMATHVAAFGITLFAYHYARAHADNPRFTFGTGKVSVLGGFSSAVALAVVALVMALESILRLINPQVIHFNNAIGVAVLGLIVNLVCGWMLREQPHRDSEDVHAGHHDHNLKAAYFHVLADALTSVLAILALISGKYFGWTWMDAIMGIVGAAVITRWSYGLIRDTSHILLDSSANEGLRSAIRSAIEQDADSRIADMHVWYLGPHHFSASLSVVTHHPNTPEYYKHLLSDIPHLAHVMVEVNGCNQADCQAYDPTLRP